MNFETLCILGLIFSYLIFIYRLWMLYPNMKSNVVLLILKLVLRFSIIGLLLLAITLTVDNEDVKKENSNANILKSNCYILVDVSNSMNTKDVQPSRIDKVKFEIESFLKTKETGKIGLIAYSETAKLISPLTDDYEALSHYVSSINTSMSDNGGSDVNIGVSKYLQLISRDKSNFANLILFTDGGDKIELESNTTRAIRSKGVISIIVGVGSKKGGMVFDNEGQAIIDENKQTVYSKLDFQNLLILSSDLGGKLSLIENNNSNVNGLAELINPNHDDSQIIEKNFTFSFNYAVYLLIAALILISLEILLKFDLIWL